MSTQQRLLPEPDGQYAQVAVPVPIEGLFSYRLPSQLEGMVEAGMRVSVPFAGRHLLGVVTEVADELPSSVDAGRVKYLGDCLDRRSVLSETMIRLAQRVATNCLVGLGEVLALALPGGAAVSTHRRVRLTSIGRASALAGLDRAERRFLGGVRSAGGAHRWVRLSAALKAEAIATPYGYCHRLVRAGLLELRDEWQGAEPGRTVASVAVADGLGLDESLRLLSRAPAQKRAFEVLWASGSVLSVDQLKAEAAVSAAILGQLERRGLIERHHTAVEVEPGPSLGPDGAGSFDLTSEQAAALQGARAAMSSSASRPLLLHGVTGSGKTEVYLRAAVEALDNNKSALLLVPEIGLTPQLEQRARAVLGDSVAILHSGLAAGERQRAWWRARRGEAKVVVGPRSAVFAPLADVGLIVVDEEQDGAYKQEERPRYNGRDVALWRAEIEGAAVLVGSATPSVETYQRAHQGTFALAPMPYRVRARPLPKVELVDMRTEWRESGRGLLSADLEGRIEERLRRGEQALLLLNRRGFASSLRCRACGARAECPHCAVTLTMHRQDRTLRCHYCDHRQPVFSVCPQCGVESLHDLGHGTEKLEALLRKLFPAARIERFDADQTQRRGAHGRILAAFGAAEIDVLVGTQMLAKGHDFPGVTLVGVIGADASLGVPDFRAAERTFQLLTQMAGRAGRGELGGEVVLQAHEPSHYAIEAAIEHDYAAFFDHEIAFRRRLRYPPFCELAVCVVRGTLAPVVKEDADRLVAALKRHAGGEVSVLGPATPPISRLRGKFRLQVLLKAPERRDLLGALRGTLADLDARKHRPRDLVIDIDPRNLM